MAFENAERLTAFSANLKQGRCRKGFKPDVAAEAIGLSDDDHIRLRWGWDGTNIENHRRSRKTALATTRCEIQVKTA